MDIPPNREAGIGYRVRKWLERVKGIATMCPEQPLPTIVYDTVELLSVLLGELGEAMYFSEVVKMKTSNPSGLLVIMVQDKKPTESRIELRVVKDLTLEEIKRSMVFKLNSLPYEDDPDTTEETDMAAEIAAETTRKIKKIPTDRKN